MSNIHDYNLYHKLLAINAEAPFKVPKNSEN